jgi:hypothetical protein
LPERRQAGEISRAEVSHTGLDLGIHQLIDSGDIAKSHEVSEFVQHDGPHDLAAVRALQDAGYLTGIQFH